MQAVWIALTVLIVGGCIWSLLRRFASKKTCCGTEKQPRIRVKKLSAPIGSLSVTAALDALDGVAAKVSLENGTARVSFERPLSDEELAQAVESAGFDVLEIRR